MIWPVRAAFTAAAVVFIWSAIAPYDRGTWWLEVFPVLLAAPLLLVTRRSFPLTPLLYGLIALHAIVLCVGGHYTYARVPLGDWLQASFGLARNPYDKLGHFMQGLVPALVAREVALRRRWVNGDGVAAGFALAVALAVSALYELLEWVTALALGQGADDFLGTQGDPWDTQSDMAMALVGALLAMLLLRRWHDRQLAACR